jgi:putative ABC transport system permease protein
MITIKLATREIKNNLKYWSLFTLNLSIGLIGFTFIYLFRENITSTMEFRAKSLLTSDIAISGRRALDEVESKNVSELLKPKIEESTKLIELYSMANTNGRSRLVLIKALKKVYPLVGEIKLQSGEIIDSDFINTLQISPHIVISPEISHQLKLKKGDSLKLGKKEFKIYGVISSDSTSSLRGVNLAPKVYIGQGFLQETNLIGQGTIAWYTDFYTMKKEFNVTETQKELHKIVTDPAVKVRTPKNSSQQLSRVVNYLSDYLGLIGVVAILISTVGANYLFQSYIFDRLKQIGILKSVGLGRGQILASFLFLISFFGIVATLVSVLFSKLLLPIAIKYLNDWVVGEFETAITMEIFLTLLCIGVFINIFVCTPILFKVFKTKTSVLLNSSIDDGVTRMDRLMYLPAVLFTWGISVWQAHSFVVGSLFAASIFIVFLVVLAVLPKILKRISVSLIGRRISFPFSLSIGYGIRLLSRNNLSSILTILCLSIGITLLSVIGQIDKSLKAELTSDKTVKPSLFLFDIQEDQYKPLKDLALKSNIPLVEPTPMIRARLIKKNGEKIKRQGQEDGFVTREDETKRRFNNRGVNLSYSSGLNVAEEITSGKPFTGRYSGEGIAEVSLEKRYARRLGVGVGDTLTYEILGVEVQGRVVSLRKIKWTSFLPNFFIVFQPGVIEEAPKSFLAAVNKVNFEQQLDIQDKIVTAFPNISILNVTTVIEKVLNLFNAMAWAVGVMSLCCICVGLFVLYSILQSQMHKKQKDLALQKLMGMSEVNILKTLLSEYSFLVIFSIFIGNSFGMIVALIVSRLFLDGVFIMNWEFFILFNGGLLMTSILMIIISFKANYNKSIKSLLND